MRILHTSDWHLGRSFHRMEATNEVLELVRDQLAKENLIG